MTSAHKNVTPVEDGARFEHAEKMHSNSNERGKKKSGQNASKIMKLTGQNSQK